MAILRLSDQGGYDGHGAYVDLCDLLFCGRPVLFPLIAARKSAVSRERHIRLDSLNHIHLAPGHVCGQAAYFFPQQHLHDGQGTGALDSVLGRLGAFAERGGLCQRTAKLDRDGGSGSLLSRLYRHRLTIRIIEAGSPLGLWKQIRHRVFRTPAFIIDRKMTYTGWDNNALQALIDERMLSSR